MMYHTASFLQAHFYCTPTNSRCLICPLTVNLSSPDGRTWKVVNDEIFKQIGSKSLLTMVASELTRDLRTLTLEHINGWVFHSQRALIVKDKLETASRRYGRIRDGIFKEELQAVTKKLFTQDPRFQARLSQYDATDDAVEEVVRRVLSQCRLSWEMGLFPIVDRRSFGIRLMILMHEMLSENATAEKMNDKMMSSRKFACFDSFANRMEQFFGIDTRFDKALADYKYALRCLPDDGSSLYGGGLKDFWRELTHLGDYLQSELENDFYEQPGFLDDYDEESLNWNVEINNPIDDLVTMDQINIDTGVDIGWPSDTETGGSIPNISDQFDIGVGG